MKATALVLAVASGCLATTTFAQECGSYFDTTTNPLDSYSALGSPLRHVSSSGAKRLEQIECEQSPCINVYSKTVIRFDHAGRVIADLTTTHPESKHASTMGALYEYKGESRYPYKKHWVHADHDVDPDSRDVAAFVSNSVELDTREDGLSATRLWSRSGDTLTWMDTRSGEFQIYKSGRLKSKRYIEPGLGNQSLADLDCKYSNEDRDLVITGRTRKVRGPLTALWLIRLDGNDDVLYRRNTFIGWSIVEFEYDYLSRDAKGNWTHRIQRTRGGFNGPSTRTSETTRKIEYW